MVMMAVIGLCLPPSDQDRSAALRQTSSYIWVPPVRNPLDLAPTLRLQPIGTQGKSRISAIASGKIPKRRIGKKPRRDERVALEVQAPEVRWHLLEFQAQFPAAPALVSTPHQDGVANVLVR